MGISDTIKKLPLINSDSKKIRIAGYILYAWLGLSVLGAILPTPDGSSPADESKTAEEWFAESQFLFNQADAKLDDESPEKYNDAFEAISKAVELDPKNITYLMEKASILSDMEKYDEAIEICDKIMEINPKYYPALTKKAWYLSGAGKYEEAVAADDMAIEINPNSIQAWADKTNYLYELGRFAESDSADAEYMRLFNLQDATVSLNEDDLKAIKKWYSIGIPSHIIAEDIGGRHTEKVDAAIERMIAQGELKRQW